MRAAVLPRGLALLLALAPCAGCGLAGALATEVAVAPGGGGSAAGASAGERAWALEVLERVNGERRAAGLAPLAWCPAAAEAAYAHSFDMRARAFFAHQNPDGAGPGDRLRAAGVLAFVACGENIARGFDSPAAVVEAWMGSPGHRANLLHPRYTHLGVGVHSGPREGPWWTQDFHDQAPGAPAAQASSSTTTGA